MSTENQTATASAPFWLTDLPTWLMPTLVAVGLPRTILTDLAVVRSAVDCRIRYASCRAGRSRILHRTCNRAYGDGDGITGTRRNGHRYGGNSTLAIWETDFVPSEKQCASRGATDGSDQATNLVAGNRVCGKTGEGRIFRIEILGIGSNGIQSKTTVWGK
jgi:hypothetical protein